MFKKHAVVSHWTIPCQLSALSHSAQSNWPKQLALKKAGKARPSHPNSGAHWFIRRVSKRRMRTQRWRKKATDGDSCSGSRDWWAVSTCDQLNHNVRFVKTLLVEIYHRWINVGPHSLADLSIMRSCRHGKSTWKRQRGCPVIGAFPLPDHGFRLVKVRKQTLT